MRENVCKLLIVRGRNFKWWLEVVTCFAIIANVLHNW